MSNIFLKRELISQTLKTQATDIDYLRHDLKTVLTDVKRVIQQLFAILRTPKGSIFRARELGSNLYLYEFRQLEEDTSGMLAQELKLDLERQITGLTVREMSFSQDVSKKKVIVNLVIEVDNKSYILPPIETSL
jgi:phage baseplate assembly protein W